MLIIFSKMELELWILICFLEVKAVIEIVLYKIIAAAGF